jgi:hypothetical protein
MQNKLEYFTRKDPAHLLIWVLIVSFANFSKFVKQQIDKMGITLIVIGRHADKTNRSTFIRSLFRSKLYSIAKRLKPQKRKISGSTIHYSIATRPQYSCAVSSAKKVLDYLHQHRDTPQNSTEAPIRRFPDRRRFLNEARFSH